MSWRRNPPPEDIAEPVPIPPPLPPATRRLFARVGRTRADLIAAVDVLDELLLELGGLDDDGGADPADAEPGDPPRAD